VTRRPLDRLDDAIAESRELPSPLGGKDPEIERRDAEDYKPKDWREETPLPQREGDDISV
jgi:hypothetical protein